MIATQTKLVHCYLLPKRSKLFRVCYYKHKTEGQCKKAHSVPPEATWSGWWPEETIGDLLMDLSGYRSELRKARGKLKRQLRRLRAKTPAPAFKAWHEQAIQDHLANEPKFCFEATEEYAPVSH